MQRPSLHGYSHHQPSHKQHVGVIEVVEGCLLSGEDAQSREEDNWKESSDRQRYCLSHPVHSNDGYHIGSSRGLYTCREYHGQCWVIAFIGQLQ